MGKGYAILIWDGWGAGLVRINPRLLTEGEDIYGNPNNWFPIMDMDATIDEYFCTRKHPSLLDCKYWEIIW